MKVVRIIGKIILWLILSLVTIYSVTVIIEKLVWQDKIPSVFGYKNFIVLTGSMEPTLKIGDIVIVKDTKEFTENDIISYRVNNSVVTHRVDEIRYKNDKREIITKGDANNSVDDEIVHDEDVEGKLVFRIAYLGNIIMFLKTKSGIAVLISVFLLSIFILSIEKKEEVKEEK